MTFRTCCCGTSGGCIYTAYNPIDGDDPPVCLHSTSEELYLNIPRPAYTVETTEVCLNQAGQFPVCICDGECYRFGVTATAASDIECRYEHYNAQGTESPQAGEDAPWVYTTGIIGNPNFNPGQLWPFALAKNTIDIVLDITGTSPCYNSPNVNTSKSDATCIAFGHGLASACSSARWTNDPGTGARRYSTKTQNDIIETGEALRGDNINTNGACTSEVPTTYSTGEQFDWLKNFHDLNYQFTQYFWDVANQQVSTINVRTASECLIAVFHRERWWNRYFNSLDAELPTDPPANCRTFEKVSFSCAGIPVMGFEIMDLKYNDLVAEGGNPERIIERIFTGQAMVVADLRAMENVGLLELKDWTNEPIDPAFPLRTSMPTNGEPIRKQWQYVNNGQVESGTFYMAARPGGWSIICNGATNSDANWPQIPRNSSTFSPVCNGTTGIYPQFEAYACMSAAPFPNPNETCLFSGFGCGNWTPCQGAAPNGCIEGPQILRIAEQEAWAASCAGILFKYTSYYLRPAGKGTAIEPWNCQLQNEATLAVVPNGQTSGTGNLDLTALREQLFHRIPFEVSRSFRNGWGTNIGNLCCGGEGIYQCSQTFCPATSPTTGNC